MDTEEKERLEQELRFLKESLDAGVISQDEYDRGKTRIEGKLSEGSIEIKEIKEETKIIGAERATDAPSEEIVPVEAVKPLEEATAQTSDKPAEEVKTESSETASEEKPTETTENKAPEEKPAVTEEKPAEANTEVDKSFTTPEDAKKEAENDVKEEVREINISKGWVAFSLIVIVALFFMFKGCSTDEVVVELCDDGSVCEADLPVIEDAATTLYLIESDDCLLCETDHMVTIIEELFPKAEIVRMDVDDNGTDSLVDDLGIVTLPAYVFETTVTETMNFGDFESALELREDHYVVRSTASGNYYFTREEMPNQLDVYVTPETQSSVEGQLSEIIDLFGSDLEIIRHRVRSDQESQVKSDLGINTYPAFLLNNQVTFRGVLPADIIKEKICTLNELDGCEETLSTTV